MNEIIAKSMHFRQVCQLRLSLIVAGIPMRVFQALMHTDGKVPVTVVMDLCM